MWSLLSWGSFTRHNYLLPGSSARAFAETSQPPRASLLHTLPLHTVYILKSVFRTDQPHPSSFSCAANRSLVSPDLDFPFSNTHLFMPPTSHTVISLTLIGSFEAHSLVSSREQGWVCSAHLCTPAFTR